MAAPIAGALGLYVYDVEVTSGRRRRIRVIAERRAKPSPTQGVTIDECVALSRELGRAMELEEVVEGSYHLEVSSPGLERPLKRAEHFRSALGERVRLLTARPVGGSTEVEGPLLTVSEDQVVVDVGGHPVEVKLEDVRKARTVFRP